MLKQLFVALGTIVLTAAGYSAVMAAENASGSAAAAATAPATQTAAVDVKNTKCIVSQEAVEGDDQTTVTYQGKIYHFCCSMCVEKFNKNPDKYIKALAADPAAYGVKK